MYPVIYDLTYSYTGFAVGLGDGSFPGTQLDADLAGFEASITGLNVFIMDVFTSEGVLKPAALPEGATFETYIVEVAAIAVAEATALSAASAAAADDSADDASVAALAASASATGALASQVAAAAASSTASGSATAASGSATAASTSASNAATSETNAAASAATLNAAIFGQCRLARVDASTIRLDRQDGQLLTIGGVVRTIPAPGPTLAVTGLVADTTYYVYAYMVGSTITLEASATVPVAGTNGQQIKTGDATRALVGMVNPITGPAFADTASARRVLSYYQRRPKNVLNGFTTDRTTTSTTNVEINSENRVTFLSWGEADERFALNGWMSHSVVTGTVYAVLALDAIGTVLSQSQAISGGNAALSYEPSGAAITAGLHTLLWGGRIVTAGIATYSNLCELHGQIRG